MCACVCVHDPVGKRESLPWFHSCVSFWCLWGGFSLPAVLVCEAEVRPLEMATVLNRTLMKEPP